MAIAFVQKTAKFTGNGVGAVTSAALNTTTDDLMVITVATYCTAPITLTPTDSRGNTWNAGDRISRENSFATGRFMTAGAIAASAGTSHTIVVTSDNATTYFEGNFSDFSGSATSSITDVSSTQVTAPTTTTTLITAPISSQADTLAVGCISLDGGSPGFTISDPPAGYVKIDVNPNNNTEGYQASYAILASVTTQSISWTYDSTAALGGTVGGLILYKASASTSSPSEAIAYYPYLSLLGVG